MYACVCAYTHVYIYMYTCMNIYVPHCIYTCLEQVQAVDVDHGALNDGTDLYIYRCVSGSSGGVRDGRGRSPMHINIKHI